MTRSQVCQQFSIYLKKIMLTPSFLLAEALLLASDKPLKVIEPNANCIYDQDCAEIHRSILLLTKKKRGGQNRTAQWSRKGKSKNLDSKFFLFHSSTVFVFESLEEVSKASKHYWNSTCIRTLFTSEVLSQLNLIDWSTSKKAFSVLNHCALCRQAKTEIRRRLTSIWFDHSMVNATLNKVVEYMTTIGRL